MYFGMNFGNFFGEPLSAAIFAAITEGDPGGRTLSWTPTNATEATYHVMLDKVEFYRTSETSVDGVPQDVRDHIELIETSEENFDEDVTAFASSPSDRIAWTWSEVAGATNQFRYELYRKISGGSYGDPIAYITAGQAGYEVLDGPLDDATYVGKVIVYDAAGNPRTSNEPEQAVSAAPDPPSNIAVSVAANTLSMTYTAGPSSDNDHHAIRRSVSVGDSVLLDGTPHATDVASPWTEDVTGMTGRLAYLLRAVDSASNEEANLSQMVVVDLSNGVMVSRPNSPVIGGAEAIESGEVRVHARYDRQGETGVATSIHMYVNDGAGGAMDWGTSVGNVTLPTGLDYFFVDVDSSGLTGAKTYLVGIRAKTDAAVEDANTNTVSVLTDAAAPAAPVLTAEIV